MPSFSRSAFMLSSDFMRFPDAASTS